MEREKPQREGHTMGKLPYDAYIFDLDGTMTQSEPGIVKSVQ